MTEGLSLSLSRCYEQASANARLERVHEDPSLRILPAGRPRYAEALRRCVSRLQSITGDLHLGKHLFHSMWTLTEGLARFIHAEDANARLGDNNVRYARYVRACARAPVPCARLCAANLAAYPPQARVRRHACCGARPRRIDRRVAEGAAAAAGEPRFQCCELKGIVE